MAGIFRAGLFNAYNFLARIFRGINFITPSSISGLPPDQSARVYQYRKGISLVLGRIDKQTPETEPSAIPAFSQPVPPIIMPSVDDSNSIVIPPGAIVRITQSARVYQDIKHLIPGRTDTVQPGIDPADIAAFSQPVPSVLTSENTDLVKKAYDSPDTGTAIP